MLTVTSQWYKGKDSTDPQIEFKSVTVCPFECVATDSMNSITAAQTPPPSNAVKKELSFIAFQKRIANAQEPKFRVVQLNDESMLKSLSETFKERLAAKRILLQISP